MERMRISICMLVLLALCACKGRGNAHERVNLNSGGNSKDTNLISVKTFGDSLCIEIEKHGDTILKHHIDLKGRREDTFDDSYTAVCTYKTIRNDSSVRSNFYITEGDYRLYFNRSNIIAYCDSIIKVSTNTDDALDVKDKYKRLRAYVIDQNTFGLPYTKADLILSFNCKILNKWTGTSPHSILVEFYRTEFSGGKNFYLLDSNGDTMLMFHCMDWIS